MASESNGTRWTLWWRGTSWHYYISCFFLVLCFLLLMSLTCFNTTLFKCLWYPFSILSKFFPCKIRSNYIARIQMIYCVKRSHLLWCLNARVMKNASSLFCKDASLWVYAEHCIQTQELQASFVCWAHWLLLVNARKSCLTLLSNSRPWSLVTFPEFDAIVGSTAIVSVEIPSQAKALSGHHKVFDFSPSS